MRATTQTVPLRRLLRQMPDLAAVLIERHGVPESELRNMHVLLTEEWPSSTASPVTARMITTAILVDRPIKVGVYGVGTAIKGPDDAPDKSVGRSIAIARAGHRAAWRFLNR